MEKSMYDRLVATEQKFGEIEAKLTKIDASKELDKFKSLSKERSKLEPIVEKFRDYKKLLDDLKGATLMSQDNDKEIVELAKEEIKKDQTLCDGLETELRVLLMPKDPNDGKDIIFEIKGAVGGEEADLFAGDLFRMYTRYCDIKGRKYKIIDETPSNLGGYSYIQFVISGEQAYSRLKYESGVHRVQRVPRTEANGRIHTSTATVVVMPKIEANEIVINTQDLRVDRYRSQGAGGQNVNKTESAVRITHIPSGIVVSCQTEKSQIQNYEICMEMLASKLAQFEEEKKELTEATYRSKIGSGDRNEKIRTYNYPQNRLTDHRIGYTVNQLDRILEGDIDGLTSALINYDQERKISEFK
jgi:peptide chain release factor 1